MIRDIELRRNHLRFLEGGGLEFLDGTIDEVGFAWTWTWSGAGDLLAGFATGALLTVRGVRLRSRITDAGRGISDVKSAKAVLVSKSKSSLSKISSHFSRRMGGLIKTYLLNHLKQIIATMELKASELQMFVLVPPVACKKNRYLPKPRMRAKDETHKASTVNCPPSKHTHQAGSTVKRKAPRKNRTKFHPPVFPVTKKKMITHVDAIFRRRRHQDPSGAIQLGLDAVKNGQSKKTTEKGRAKMGETGTSTEIYVSEIRTELPTMAQTDLQEGGEFTIYPELCIGCDYVHRFILKNESAIYPFEDTPRSKNETKQCQHEESENHDNDESAVHERLSIGSLYISLLETKARDEGNISGYILAPVSYSALVRGFAGMRILGGLGKNIEVIGQPIATYAESLANGDSDGIFIRVSEEQLLVLQSLMAPATPRPVPDAHSGSTIHPLPSRESSPASLRFELPFTFVSLVLPPQTLLTSPGLRVSGLANGSVVQINAQKIDLWNGSEVQPTGACASVSSIQVKLKPNLTVVFCKINTLFLPGMVKLCEPLHGTVVRFKEGTMSINMTTAEVVLLKPNPQPQETPKRGTRSPLPFRTLVVLQELIVKARGRSTKVLDLLLDAKQLDDRIHTRMQFGDVKFDEMLQLSGIEASGLVDPSQPDTVHNLNILLKSASAAKGFSSQDWENVVVPRWSKSPPIRLPFVIIHDFYLRISVEAGAVSSNDTVIYLESFKGGRGTTSLDLRNHYSQVVARQVPRFLSETNVYGVNVVDTTVAIVGTTYWSAFAGPFGGIAALLTYDGIKYGIKKGKQSRGAPPEDLYRPGDFIRGVVFVSKEATEVDLRDVPDNTVGAAGDYVVSEKARLAGAGGAAAGFIAGGAIGGPVGAIIGAIVVGAVAQKAVEMEEEEQEKKFDAITSHSIKDYKGLL